MHFKFGSLAYKYCFEVNSISLFQTIKHFFVLVIVVGTHRKYKICKDLRFCWRHLDQDWKVMVVVEQIKTWLLLSFNFSIIATPTHDIVFVFLIESHFSRNIVLNNFLTTTVLKIFRPSCANFCAGIVMVVKGILVDKKIWTHVNIIAGECSKYHGNYYCIQTGKNYWALANTDVPNLKK